MLSFASDYTEGACEEILQKLAETNRESLPGYGMDRYCQSAARKIQEATGCPEAEVYFLVGGTQTNAAVISSMLAPYEGVVAAQTGHVSIHEAGAIEYTGHKVLQLPEKDGKEVVQKLVDAGKIEVKSSQFLRGNNIDNAIVIVSEAQNFGRDTFLKILTRIGTNSRYIFNSDELQLDSISLKSGKNQKGLQYAIEKLSDMDEIGIVEFGLEDIVRNDLIPGILKRWLPEVYGDLDEEEISKKSKQERLDE